MLYVTSMGQCLGFLKIALAFLPLTAQQATPSLTLPGNAHLFPVTERDHKEAFNIDGHNLLGKRTEDAETTCENLHLEVLRVGSGI